ncbi:E3 ubiquitin-protein ligase TRIM9-like isoform X1 [Branchiostoma lanceolatum]|uniref:TRIM9 protein n=1 Tax=Branchiostoma lanceolatum TaxID=7740 RepID=A0A8J9ZRD5_BRALA|nr:TRIM9 [Branchiostoma lanceolatum]
MFSVAGDRGSFGMEEELKCPVCRCFFNVPIILPCQHSICLSCAASQVTQTYGLKPTEEDALSYRHSTISSPGSDYSSAYDYTDLDKFDKLSLYSEADSGYGASLSGYAATCPSSPAFSTVSASSSISTTTSCIRCPQCRRTTYLDDLGVQGFPRNKALQTIVEKYEETKNIVIKCQLCVGQAPNDATVMCEQCSVYYCDKCRENCHPLRGPLAKHTLVSPALGKAAMKARNQTSQGVSTCIRHTDENISMFCIMCKIPVCYQCLEDGKHQNHDVKALGAMCKMHKAELSHNISTLSDKAREGKNFLSNLREMLDQVQENSVDFEASLVAQCDAIIEAINRRKEELMEQIQREKEHKLRMMREQINDLTNKLRQTTGLLEYALEIMKEEDAAAFLQVANGLIKRVCSAEMQWQKEVLLEPHEPPEFELQLNSQPLFKAIEQLNFVHTKGSARVVTVPGPPIFLHEECTVQNNSITVSWQPSPRSWVDGYVLELDDGNQGPFREVYVGRETLCTLDGLHFDCTYRVRVKAFNKAGEGPYSDSVQLHTAEVAWFALDPSTAHPDIVLSNDNMTVTCNSYDDRVVLGNVGFSKGIHYWECTIDRYDNHPDPAFGVARIDTLKDTMLGKDDKAWAMYIDSNRSWFMHNNAHSNRTEGGLDKGSVIGVLLNLEEHTLSFYVNDCMQGPIAFRDLHGVFFPAISLNRNVQMTVHTGLELPDHDSIDGE